MIAAFFGPLVYCFWFAASATAEPGLIDNSPAPPPDEGPPGAAHASRNKALLPAQICGIVGGYILTVLFFGILLLTVGRRMRRTAQASPASLEIEMVKHTNKAFDPSPISPLSASRQWLAYKWKKSTTSLRSNNSQASHPTSPVVGSPGGMSVSSFDQSVIDYDKEQRQREMERLYAVVMEEEAKKARTQYASVDGDGERPVSSGEDRNADTRRPDRRPPQIMTRASAGTRLEVPVSPTSPRSPIRAIYPPDSPMSRRQQPSYYPTAPSSPQPHPQRHPAPPSSPRNLLTRHSRSSSNSSNNKSRRSIRNLRISAPIQRYPGDEDDEARTPLSPRFYNPPAPPSPPSQAQNPVAPVTPYTPGTDGEYADERLDQPAPLPMARPSRVQELSINTGAANSRGTLPFRAMANGAQSAPATKTTYLERRMDAMHLGSPRTGVPMTPYSPYMPFTPITPVTPHLVSKKERKQMQKEKGRRVAVDTDLVKDDGDMWDSGY